MDLGIRGRRALVTGASQGIGKAVAISLAAEGAKVIVTSRRKAVLDEVVEEIGGESEGHMAIAVDLAEEGGPSRLAKATLDSGPIDIVVHNVGGTLEVRSALSTMEDWRRVWMINVGIGIEINNILVPEMVDREWGRVVHLSSEAAHGLRGCAAYGPAKAALNGYVKVLGREVATSNVIVSSILAGPWDSPGSHWDEISSENPEQIPDFLRHHLAGGRLASTDEISPVITFMCSDQVSFAAGAWMEVDGGTM